MILKISSFWNTNELFFVCLFIVCVLSSQSSWSQSATTIAGDSTGISGSDMSHLNDPIGLYYDQANNLVIVGDNGNYRVMKFSLANPPSAGIVIAGGNGAGCTVNMFMNTDGVGLDSSGHLYVSDAGCNQMLQFPSNSNSATSGVFISSIGSPEGLSINLLTNDLYVTGTSTANVYKFTSGSAPGIVAAGV